MSIAIKSRIFFVFFTVSLAASTCSLPADEARKVNLGYFPNLTHAPALIGTAKGFFASKLGGDISLGVKTFNAGPSVIEALFAGEIDIAYIGPNPAINGYVKSDGKALRIIAGSSSGGASFVVAGSSGIKTVKDLHGKKFASPQIGNTQDVALRAYISGNGLKTRDKGGDVEIMPMQNSSILTLFMQKSIDGAWVPEPWGTRLIKEAGGKLLVDERDLWPDGKFVTAQIIANTSFLEKNPGLVKKILEGHIEAIEFISRNPAESRKIMNEEIKRISSKAIPEDVLEISMSKMEITYDPLPKTLFKSAEDAFALGFLGKEKPDISGIYDLRILNAILVEKGLKAIDFK